MSESWRKFRAAWEASSPQEQIQILTSLTKDERDAVNWWLIEFARNEQIEPLGDWTNWLILAGRGFGKTRTGAEQVRTWVKEYNLVNLIGATADDARDIMVEGESGILAICPTAERPVYKKSARRLDWPNGAKSLIFTADEPNRLRGKQSEKLWADELCSWRYAEESWTQAMFGLRLGKKPQTVITTTPRPIKQLKDLMKDPATVVTRGSTYDNRANLAPGFFDYVITKYEGTRLGRQELTAEILEDVEGALWNWKNLDEFRVKAAPELIRIIIPIDPAVSTNPNSDETGIIPVGLGIDGHGYVLGDSSGVYSPLGWAQKAIAQYETLKADAMVAEVNNGGDLVEANLRAAGFKGRVIKVHASRGKQTRAEPISAYYDQGKVHHVGTFAGLESQMTTWEPGVGDSPDRVDSLVWGLTYLMTKGEPRKGMSHLGH